MIQAYNYMIESHQPNREMKTHANKRSELKQVYNTIISLSKQSPLFKINLSKENQNYTLEVKETALAIKSKLKELTVPDNADFRSRTITVSDDRVLSVKLIQEDTSSLPENMTISVNALSSPQINRGKELFNPSRGLERGFYDFRANIMDQSYELTYIQEAKTDNRDAIHKIAELINLQLPGISAAIEKGKNSDYSRIVIKSDLSGKFGEKTFSFEDNEIFREGLVDFFGLNQVEKEPSNAHFELNNLERQTTTNSFRLDNALQVTLKNTGDHPVTLRLVPNGNQILASVDSFLQSYNGMINLAIARIDETKEHFGATKLINELNNLQKLHQEELEACGLNVLDDGRFKIDETLAFLSAEDGGMEEMFLRDNGFISRVLDKMENIAINPMEYLDKTIITYPNNERIAYANPYITSMYSGLLFNSYC